MSVQITGWQVKHLLDFMDGEDEAELTLEHFAEERKDSETGEAMPPGLYAWFTEYPEEGSLLLAEKTETDLTPDDVEQISITGIVTQEVADQLIEALKDPSTR